jgi:hypothetical protein
MDEKASIKKPLLKDLEVVRVVVVWDTVVEVCGRWISYETESLELI